MKDHPITCPYTGPEGVWACTCTHTEQSIASDYAQDQQLTACDECQHCGDALSVSDQTRGYVLCMPCALDLRQYIIDKNLRDESTMYEEWVNQ